MEEEEEEEKEKEKEKGTGNEMLFWEEAGRTSCEMKEEGNLERTKSPNFYLRRRMCIERLTCT